jgi:hypothetical protein
MKKTDYEKAWHLYGHCNPPTWGLVVRCVGAELLRQRGINDRAAFTTGLLIYIEDWMNSRVKCDPHGLSNGNAAHAVATMMFDVLGITLAEWRPVWTRHVGWFVHVTTERLLKGWTNS